MVGFSVSFSYITAEVLRKKIADWMFECSPKVLNFSVLAGRLTGSWKLRVQDEMRREETDQKGASELSSRQTPPCTCSSSARSTEREYLGR